MSAAGEKPARRATRARGAPKVQPFTLRSFGFRGVSLFGGDSSLINRGCPFLVGIQTTFGGNTPLIMGRVLDCYWVGSLDCNFLGNQGFSTTPPKS